MPTMSQINLTRQFVDDLSENSSKFHAIMYANLEVCANNYDFINALLKTQAEGFNRTIKLCKDIIQDAEAKL